jgi:hypothetical protein
MPVATLVPHPIGAPFFRSDFVARALTQKTRAGANRRMLARIFFGVQGTYLASTGTDGEGA